MAKSKTGGARLMPLPFTTFGEIIALGLEAKVLCTLLRPPSDRSLGRASPRPLFRDGALSSVDDQIAQMQADPEHDARVLGLVNLSHGLLELDGRAERIDRTRDSTREPSPE